jgi:hypothetical protein
MPYVDPGDQFSKIINYTISPLTKGMVKNLPSTKLEDGTFIELNNYRNQEYGLSRRGGFIPFAFGDSPELDNVTYSYDTFNERVQDIIYYWKTKGSPEMLMVSDRQLYSLLSGGKHSTLQLVSDELILSNFQTEDLTAKQYSWHISDNEYEILEGDYTRILEDSLPSGLIISVANVDETTTKIVVQFDTYIPDGLTEFDIIHLFQPDTGFKVDWTVLPGYENKVIFTDGRRPMMQYDGVALQAFNVNEGSDPGYTKSFTKAKCLTYFADRLWFGNIEEDGQTFKQRIRWSDATNFDRVQDSSFIDLPYSDGELIDIVPLGSLLVLYFEDAIYYGRPTNLIGRPYFFERLETGNVGVVSQQSVIKVLDGHFFIGQDDIYYFSGTSAIQRIGTPILTDSLEKTKDLKLLWACQMAHDPETSTIAFLFPDQPYSSAAVPGLSTKVWRYNYKTQSWSYDSNDINNSYYFTSLMSSKYYLQSNSWEDWIDVWPEGTPDEPDNDGDVIWKGGEIPSTNPDQIKWNTEFLSWDELGYSELTPQTLFLGLYYIKDSLGLQQISYEDKTEGEDKVNNLFHVIQSEIITQDFNFNLDDTNKVATRFSMKLVEPALPFTKEEDVSGVIVISQLPLTIKAYVSNDRGQKWKFIGNMKYFKNTDEDKLDFRSKGTNIRFKLVINSQASVHKCMEFVIRVIGGGLQIDTI